MADNYIGGGRLYIQTYNELTKAYETEREVGQVKETKLSINADKEEITVHDESFEEVVDELIIKKDITLSFKTQNISLENLKIAFYGTSGTSHVATSASLVGAEPTADLAGWQSVTDGEFAIQVDGTSVSVTGLDFSGAADFAAVASTISAELTGATCSYVTDHFEITSDTTGAASELTYAGAVSGGTGTDISGAVYLAMTEASGGVLTPGGDSYKVIDVDTISTSRSRLRFVPSSARGKIKQIHFHQLSLSMDGDMPLQTTTAATLDFSGKLQKDMSITEGSKVMKIEYFD